MTMKDLTQPEPSRGSQGKMANTDFASGPQGKMSAFSHVYMEPKAPEPPPPMLLPPKAPEPPAVAPDDIEESANRAINRLKIDIDALEKRLSDEIVLARTENQESSTPFTPIEQYVERPTSPDIPFEIMVSYTGESPLVYVRNGGFYDGETFAGTDGSTSFETFDYTTLDASFGVGDEVWATLTITLSTGAWAASLDTTEQTASTGERVISVLIGTISIEGGVRQNITGHIPVIGGEEDDHSFRPTRSGDTGASITPGNVIFGDGTRSLISPADINFATNTKFWLVIDYSSATPVAGPNLVGGTAWPAFIGTDTKTYPIMEFPDNTFASLIRRQTNDIVDSPDTFVVRGTGSIFRLPALRAYLTADDSIVAPGTAYNAATMYFYPTWDFVRWP